MTFTIEANLGQTTSTRQTHSGTLVNSTLVYQVSLVRLCDACPTCVSLCCHVSSRPLEDKIGFTPLLIFGAITLLASAWMLMDCFTLITLQFIQHMCKYVSWCACCCLQVHLVGQHDYYIAFHLRATFRTNAECTQRFVRLLFSRCSFEWEVP